VLKAPVLAFWSFSKISCSSLGRRGGAGPVLKDVDVRLEVLKARRERRRGRRAVRRCAAIVRILGSCVYVEFLLHNCQIALVVVLVKLSLKLEGDMSSSQCFHHHESDRGLRGQSEHQVATEMHFRRHTKPTKSFPHLTSHNFKTIFLYYSRYCVTRSR
jgi:hypothetical protein